MHGLSRGGETQSAISFACELILGLHAGAGSRLIERVAHSYAGMYRLVCGVDTSCDFGASWVCATPGVRGL